ncbi:hypothetical protein [Mumia zhuanghuii]|nr:hypothetical protein [Mumia zhuanghuii]
MALEGRQDSVLLQARDELRRRRSRPLLRHPRALQRHELDEMRCP